MLEARRGERAAESLQLRIDAANAKRRPFTCARIFQALVGKNLPKFAATLSTLVPNSAPLAPTVCPSYKFQGADFNER